MLHMIVVQKNNKYDMILDFMIFLYLFIICYILFHIDIMSIEVAESGYNAP